MTLQEAREHIGHGVVYRPFADSMEKGVITSVGDRWVFVRYDGWGGSKATDAAALSLLAPEVTP